MKTNFKALNKLIEGMNDDDYMLDNDLNLSVLSQSLKKQILKNLNISNKGDVSRFLTMVICFSENGTIDDEMINWSNDEYIDYLRNSEITEEMDNEYVKEFLLGL